ncbi:polysaccharide deacetylase family protein [Streptomyces sp. ACA25]|uniref:polysaccharide deacetylase family protein n=1 Tax=Streptomyces sp. ACA25 TaxID=3022596 RepID=UPI00230750B2|nr:polysaccharide deacetylase family protein [Streptomyces sp. ACA25]MDB1089163.1 polysaccharide deacetylase family protein [Streptomyces sp. ACA25]
MIIFARCAALPFLLVLAVLSGCAGTRNEPAADRPTAGRPASPEPPPTAAAGPPALPLDARGRIPVFSHGSRDPGDDVKRVALTFDADMTRDQGPRAAAGERFDNPELIELLRQEKVASTIFMTGMWARTYPDQAATIGRDPLFEVANHTFSHYAYTAGCYGLPRLTPGEFRSDAERAATEILAAGVPQMAPYFRFPGGCYDDAALHALAPTGVTAVQWDVSGGDAFATDPGGIADHVLDEVRPGSVVVLHCTRSAAPATAEAMRRIIPGLRARGYEFVRVSDLIAADRPH